MNQLFHYIHEQGGGPAHAAANRSRPAPLGIRHDGVVLTPNSFRECDCLVKLKPQRELTIDLLWNGRKFLTDRILALNGSQAYGEDCSDLVGHLDPSKYGLERGAVYRLAPGLRQAGSVDLFTPICQREALKRPNKSEVVHHIVCVTTSCVFFFFLFLLLLFLLLLFFFFSFFFSFLLPPSTSFSFSPFSFSSSSSVLLLPLLLLFLLLLGASVTGHVRTLMRLAVLPCCGVSGRVGHTVI